MTTLDYKQSGYERALQGIIASQRRENERLRTALAQSCDETRYEDHDAGCQRAKRAEAENVKLRAALEFYADPETYHAIGFFPDPPCGEFMTDFSDDHGHEHYIPRPMPGKRARRAIANEQEEK